MRKAGLAAAVLLLTFGWLAALFAVEPFDRINDAMDRTFGALPAWTQVETMYRDPEVMEVSRGDHPLESFRILSAAWARHPQSTRIILMGNSQTQSTSLAAGEARPSGPEKTYTDLIADHYRQAGNDKLFYRLSSGGMSYEEMLWYVEYLALKPEIKPAALLVQLNYQNFANGGIREGMFEMLADDEFRRRIAELANSGRLYAETYAAALHRFEERQRRSNDKAAAEGPATTGYRMELAFRDRLDHVPGFGVRPAFKQSFVYMLYRCRSYILRLQPATRRSLGGPRLEVSRAALDEMVAVARRAGIRVILFQAPTNPRVPLYRTDADDRSYHEFCSRLAARYGLQTFDFEHTIPAERWGMTMNVPDPLHLSRAGHRMLADAMLEQARNSGL